MLGNPFCFSVNGTAWDGVVHQDNGRKDTRNRVILKRMGKLLKYTLRAVAGTGVV